MRRPSGPGPLYRFPGLERAGGMGCSGGTLSVGGGGGMGARERPRASRGEGEGFAVSPGGGTHLTSQAGDGGRVGWEGAVYSRTRLVAGREAAGPSSRRALAERQDRGEPGEERGGRFSLLRLPRAPPRPESGVPGPG